MARKVFISVLGTGFYGECRYGKEDFVSSETRFIQQATAEMLVSTGGWTYNDQGYIILTDAAKKMNWNVEGNARKNRSDEYEPYVGLEDAFRQMNLPFPIEGVDIPVGNNEKEIWTVFSTIYSKIQEKDEIYLDITHGFRYLPMLLLVLCHYAKFLKGVAVKSITYGNYEARTENLAPIVDITSFSALQDWTNSGASFLEQGRVRNFTDSVALSLGSSSPVTNKVMENVKKLNKDLNELEGQLLTCRGNELLAGTVASEAKALTSRVARIEQLPDPLKEILNKINSAISPFGQNTMDNLLYALDWCKRYHLIQQGYTLCQEGIVSYVCKHLADINPCVDSKNKDAAREYRDYWSAILGLSVGDAKDESKWKGGLAKNRKLTRALLNLKWVKDLRNKYGKLTQKRNQLNHAGFVGKVSSKEIIEAFEARIDDIIPFFSQELEKPVIEQPRHFLFINLSNHPSAGWTAEQLSAAQEYGEVVDMPFPQVAPDATEDDITKLADEQADKIRQLAADAETIVHVMGEMSLTYRLVSRLTALGIRCVCSTSYRIVKEEGDGKRLVEFHFNKFRSYE